MSWYSIRWILFVFGWAQIGKRNKSTRKWNRSKWKTRIDNWKKRTSQRICRKVSQICKPFLWCFFSSLIQWDNLFDIFQILFLQLLTEVALSSNYLPLLSCFFLPFFFTLANLRNYKKRNEKHKKKQIQHWKKFRNLWLKLCSRGFVTVKVNRSYATHFNCPI